MSKAKVPRSLTNALNSKGYWLNNKNLIINLYHPSLPEILKLFPLVQHSLTHPLTQRIYGLFNLKSGGSVHFSDSVDEFINIINK